mmetsp:Transcript_10019/g.11683  ORF Transcript_10019/g.11683 Transcript_10019/m.11683 type:complete len:275 (+) Transcript_10019:156-980(+)
MLVHDMRYGDTVIIGQCKRLSSGGGRGRRGSCGGLRCSVQNLGSNFLRQCVNLLLKRSLKSGFGALQRSHRHSELCLQLSPGCSKLLSTLIVCLLLQSLLLCLCVLQSGGDDIFCLCLHRCNLCLVSVGVTNLGADLAITLVKHLTDWGEHYLVENEHEHQELTHNNRESGVEIEKHTSVGGCCHNDVCEGGDESGTGGSRNLHRANSLGGSLNGAGRLSLVGLANESYRTVDGRTLVQGRSILQPSNGAGGSSKAGAGNKVRANGGRSHFCLF